MAKAISAGILALLSFSTVHAEESTAKLYIQEASVDAANSTYYFRAAQIPNGVTGAPWAASCPNALYAYARALPLMNQLYATALSAQVSGKPVIFVGSCDPDLQYFKVSRIYLEN